MQVAISRLVLLDTSGDEIHSGGTAIFCQGQPGAGWASLASTHKTATALIGHLELS
jgi:hypothetical protein